MIMNENSALHCRSCGTSTAEHFRGCPIGEAIMLGMAGMPSIEEQWREASNWASWLALAGYVVELRNTGEAEPFHREWRVFPSWMAPQCATIDIDGCGASWHGPDELWRRVIGPRVGITD